MRDEDGIDAADQDLGHGRPVGIRQRGLVLAVLEVPVEKKFKKIFGRGSSLNKFYFDRSLLE